MKKPAGNKPHGLATSAAILGHSAVKVKKNGEANVSVYDRAFAAQVERMIEDDIAHCERFTKEKWKKRGLLARFGETFFWLFSENY